MNEFEQLNYVVGEARQYFMDYLQQIGLGAFIFVVFVFFTRKYSVPIILYAVEICIYFVGMHTLVTLLTNFFSWLHNQTSMEAVSSRRADVAWDTPWIKFYDTAAYDPGWIVYMESAFAVIIILLVIKYRPMKIQKPRHQTEAAKKGEWKPDQYSSRDRARELAAKYSNPDNIGKGARNRGRR